MERSRVSLISLLCLVFFSQKKISGAEVEMRVRPGDLVYLYCDAFDRSDLDTVWFKSSSGGNQSRLMITIASLVDGDLPRFSFAWNYSNKTYDLLIRNVTEADLGVYYCARSEKTSKDKNEAEYHYGNLSTRLSLLEEAPAGVMDSPGCNGSWQLVVGVGAVCVLVSSIFSSICVCWLCRNRSEAEVKVHQESSSERKTERSVEAGGDDVCYTLLDVQKLKMKERKKKKKKKVQDSDFSTYSEVRTEGM